MTRVICFLPFLFPLLLGAQQHTYSRPEVVAFVDHHAQEYAVPRELVHALIDVESGWKSGVVSRAGAVGLMQLMPYTAFRFGGRNRFDAVDNLRTGIRYLAWLLSVFDGDLRLAIAAYYAGEGRVARRGLDYRSAEVNAYVRRVALQYYRHRLVSISSAAQEEIR